MKDVEAQIKNLAIKGKHLATYKKYYKLYEAYQNAHNKAETSKPEFLRSNLEVYID